MYAVTDELDSETFHKMGTMTRDEIGEWLEKELDKKVDIIDWDLDYAQFVAKFVYTEKE